MREKYSEGEGYLALPTAKTDAAVLVCHAWWGLNPFFESVCERLAGAGFAAFAPDLYGGKIAKTIAEAEALRDVLDREHERAKVQMKAAVHHLRSYQKLGVLGCSLGVYYAFWLANECPEEVSAVVAFYGAGEDNFDKTRAAYLGHFAETDEFEDTEYIAQNREKLAEKGLEVTFHTYPGTKHWFFESDVPAAYDAQAAELAWERTIAFLRQKLT
jgi:carboxymethylenebutenolidase